MILWHDVRLPYSEIPSAHGMTGTPRIGSQVHLEAPGAGNTAPASKLPGRLRESWISIIDSDILIKGSISGKNLKGATRGGYTCCLQPIPRWAHKTFSYM